MQNQYNHPRKQLLMHYSKRSVSNVQNDFFLQKSLQCVHPMKFEPLSHTQIWNSINVLCVDTIRAHREEQNIARALYSHTHTHTHTEQVLKQCYCKRCILCWKEQLNILWINSNIYLAYESLTRMEARFVFCTTTTAGRLRTTHTHTLIWTLMCASPNAFELKVLMSINGNVNMSTMWIQCEHFTKYRFFKHSHIFCRDAHVASVRTLTQSLSTKILLWQYQKVA